MPKLLVIVASTRPGRKGISIARWFHQFAIDHAGFEVELVDLAEIALPMFDEQHHPRMQKYEHEHTKAWSRLIASGDAYVFVTPEYNYSTPPSLSNALDYLVLEWSYKPLGFVSYGGVSGGLRGVQQTKLLAGALKMVPVPEAVSIPMFTDYIDGEGNFKAVVHHEHAAQTMLDEMLRWSGALQTLRS